MNKTELGKIAARAVLDAEGKDYDVDKIGEGATWHEGAAAVYRKAIEDALEALRNAHNEEMDRNFLAGREIPGMYESAYNEIKGLLNESP